MKLRDVLSYLRPDAEWTLVGNDYDTLVWGGPGIAPTLAECQTAWPIFQQEQNNHEVTQRRRIAFQAEADPLFFEWQRGEGTEQAWRDKVEEIRQRHPYPT